MASTTRTCDQVDDDGQDAERRRAIGAVAGVREERMERERIARHGPWKAPCPDELRVAATRCCSEETMGSCTVGSRLAWLGFQLECQGWDICYDRGLRRGCRTSLGHRRTRGSGSTALVGHWCGASGFDGHLGRVEGRSK